jgi:hypothetical protein
MARTRPTIADLRTMKGKGQLTMLRVMSPNEAAAAEQAGIDIVSVPAEVVTRPRCREVAPTIFSMTGQSHLEAGTRDDYSAFRAPASSPKAPAPALSACRWEAAGCIWAACGMRWMKSGPSAGLDLHRLDLHRFRSGQVLMLGGPLFEGHG